MLAEKRGRPSIYIVREGFGARAARVELGGCVSDPHTLGVWGHLLRRDRPGLWCRFSGAGVPYGVTFKKIHSWPSDFSGVRAGGG